MRQFVRRNTSRVIALSRTPGKATRTRSPNSKVPRSSLLGARRIKTHPRIQSSRDYVLGDIGRKRSRGLSSEGDQDSDRDSKLPYLNSVRQARPARKRALSKLGGDNNEGCGSELGRLPKRLRIKLEQGREKRKKAAADQQSSGEKTDATQQLVQERGRWLFNQDRLNLATLNQADRQTQKSLAKFQKDLMNTRPGEHLFLCLMSLPREIRDMVYEAMFQELPTTIIVHPKLGGNFRSSNLPRILPPICYVNRQIFAESVPVLLRPRKIHIDSIGARVFAQFLRRVPSKDAFRSVSSLCLGPDVTWHRVSNEEDNDDEEAFSGTILVGEELVAHCTSLRDITLEVDSYELGEDHDPDSESESDSGDVSRTNTRKSVHLIQRAYPVWPVTRCLALRFFKLVCRSDAYYLQGLDPPYNFEEFFEPLVTRVRE
jgi:hypothetical protein